MKQKMCKTQQQIRDKSFCLKISRTSPLDQAGSVRWTEVEDKNIHALFYSKKDLRQSGGNLLNCKIMRKYFYS